ncbi:MAG: heme-binding protein [Phycisphaeraceae bacterium]|nr:heme-binding protein [Phycisphaeraceae bacterium]
MMTFASVLLATAIAGTEPPIGTNAREVNWPHAGAQVVTQKATLTQAGARRVINAAIAEIRRNGTTGVIAVVDDGGNLVAVERTDGTFAAGANISIGKARTSALFKKPTNAFEEIIKGGRTPMVALNDFTPLQGGVPIFVEGEVVGAVGVSGAKSAQQDEQIAMAGAAAVASMAGASGGEDQAVVYVPRAVVDSGLAKGEVLVDTPRYAVNASRRDQPGLAEVHDDETDVFYVLDGAATLVTGGDVVGPDISAPGQVRARSIRGGEARQLVKGDVVVVPAGVPHWFKAVDAPLVYMTVKVKSEAPVAP